MKPIEHFEAGELQQAVATALESVKSAPTDLEKRMILCQMLSFAGDFERADKQLDLLATQSPDVAISLAEFRQLIRAEQARRDFYTNGRLPEFLGEPTESQKLQLKASIALREGNAAEAGKLLNEALEISPEIQGTCNGEAFTGFRDLDDLLGTTIELLTNNGKYYWVPAERIRELSFAPAEAYHHLLWRRAEIRVEDGPEGVVYLPAIYANPGLDDDDKMKLGRMTDWHEVPEGPILGIGQKTWLVGENDLPIMTIETFSVSTERE
ncbi:type VI secretion system accessory protein TagJ [Rubinisphaera italica]|uniref:ImpE protein n=1 Tax=Rubinisphaera italica TaxID=2527969 RepID=A0A5C5XMV5_9PLAN|nr:type VI secretion system accessory protein TagJ [Rubinisphaera italica]TWT63909.1 ImpE protein [Rubinisphaera italica]